MVLLHLTLLAIFGASVANAVTVKQEQLFKLVARVVKQPTQRLPFKIEGYYVSSTDFITNARASTLIPKSGFTTNKGKKLVPENYYTNSSSNATVRQPTAAAADAAKPYNFLTDTLGDSPPGYDDMEINYDYADPGTMVFTVAAGQPYFGSNNPPNNYNNPDPAEGHFLACNADTSSTPKLRFYISQGITDPNAPQGSCAQIRLLPECAGNFTGSGPPGNVKFSSCYVNATTAPLPTLSN